MRKCVMRRRVSGCMKWVLEGVLDSVREVVGGSLMRGLAESPYRSFHEGGGAQGNQHHLEGG